VLSKATFEAKFPSLLRLLNDRCACRWRRRREMDPTAGRFRRQHRAFLAENRPDVYAALQRAGRLDSYLTSIGETASERLDHVMSQHLADPEIQRLSFADRARELRARQLEAEEIIRNDLILQPAGPCNSS
jgi:hypothetical protein